ncbi:hypothetical protein D7Z54_02850 [Salibacterium salarium]|uniref:histidine kinase n=1 Tax=Salibacterium salarium TaxID=284579 RepID=A0A428N8R7_9BACI|nr:sensor histidine kinase [Salibacterium salarium]RSL34794.1 hypothetical protein D7Z54_02850 [Salibacterium salarium]
MKNIIYFLILCIGSLLISGCGLLDNSQQVQAEQGVLNLQGTTMQQDDTYILDGEWEFYWERLMEPSELDDIQPNVFLNTPGNWYDDNGQFSNHGYATYRLKILLPDEQDEKVLGMHIPDMNTAYTIWANGKELASNGEVGTSQSEMQPKHHPNVIYFKTDKALNLVVQVSDFHQRKSGWSDSIHIGHPEAIQNMRDANVAMEVFFVASLLMMGLYHIGIFILRPKDKSTLYFGGVCLAISMRTLLLGEVLLVRFIPSINWELSLKLEYLGSCLGMIFFLLFIYTQYREDMNNRVRNILLLFFVGFAAFILITPARIYTEAMVVLQFFSGSALVYLIFVLIKALRKKRRGALLHITAMIILLFFVLNDILYYNHVLNTGETVSLGLLTYLFAQSFILSNVFTRALNQSEQLSKRLEIVNQTLEVKVEQRTQKLSETNRELEQANKRLENMYKSRQEMMSNISHELGTPLTSIQGYIKGMMDGVVDRNHPKYLQLVYNKTLFLRQIIQDLRELARLESDKMKYRFVRESIGTFVQSLAAGYRHEIERKDIRFYFDNQLDSDEVMVSLDHIRMEQVITNLLFNARKFTPSGGRIKMVLSTIIQENESMVKIAVHDTGNGIQKDELPKVFDRFYKGKSNENRSKEGVGLGLAICAEIVRAHGGKMGADSQEAEGSTFYFTLPILERNV